MPHPHDQKNPEWITVDTWDGSHPRTSPKRKIIGLSHLRLSEISLLSTDDLAIEGQHYLRTRQGDFITISLEDWQRVRTALLLE